METLQGLRFAAKASGIEQQTLDMALQRFTRRAAEAAQGTGEAKDALAQMGDGRLRRIDRRGALARHFGGPAGEYLLAWLKTIGIERAVLAGHDMGGGVVQIAAVRQPARCAGLFLTNAIGYDSWPIPSVKMMRALGPVVQQLPNGAFKGVFATFIKRGHDNPARASESIDAHWPHYARQGGAAAFVRQVCALNVHDTL